MDDLNHTNEPIDFNFLTSMQIKAGRICSSSWKDTEGVKPRFSGISTYKAAVGITAAGIVGGSVTTTTPTSSTIKNEQDEKILHFMLFITTILLPRTENAVVMYALI
jgi:hypothetical protein